ncbi:ribonuclease E/G [Caldovatus sp. SYSU G05006]|uniref:Ribonuclease E/G n=2 Tax=Caldovatus aquaticus TaxID=2865671 RepID=A0ABS7F646_9PROT|nr:ribonuclease E/G [Caldovatus aquaticus]
MPMTRTDDRIRGTVPPDAAAEAAEDHMAPAGAVETVTLAGTTAPAAGPAPSVPPAAEAPAAEASAAAPETAAEAFPAAAEAEAGRGGAGGRPAATAAGAPPGAGEGEAEGGARDDSESEPAEELPPPPETLGGEGAAADAEEEARRERRIPPRFLRQYKIQEVIKRRQIMLVQVVKEERGSKGAALTTYISLAGRFSVLMPNSPRGGGVSRKITSAADRKRLREIIDELGLPEGMSLIIRTAGANRPKAEIKRDCEYLLRLWDSIRERTLQSTAPALIYEEADLIKRSIRDVYGRDIEEIIVEGEDAYREAREFMRMLMPSHVRKIQLYRDPVPLFVRYGVEQQLEAMYSPVVQLKSGGTIVIHQTEALVAIDVNSGRATRDRHIEDTALKVNLEAADEIARQLRLRDLAGLIVIDFIDMESAKHDAMVERRLKEALKHDRARIQVGRISHFGLLEMSRQRLRPSLAEHAFVTCSYCQGRGQVRSIESSALAVLRAIEEEGAKRRAAEIAVRVAQPLALFLLNRRRDRLAAIEARYNMRVTFEVDDTLVPPALRIERVRPQTAALPGAESPAPSAALRMDYAPEPEEAEEAAEPAAEEAAPEAAGEAAPAEAEPVRAAGEAEGEGAKRRRRRRRRRSGRREEGGAPLAAERAAEGAPAEPGEEEYEEEQAAAEATAPGEAEQPAAAAEEEAEGRPGEDEEEGEERRNGGRRRRGRRGGRRRRPELESEAVARGRAGPERLASEAAASAPPPAVAQPAAAPPAARYGGPTPADPFAGHIEDIYEAMAAAEAAAEAAAAARRASPPEASPAAPQSAPEAAAAAPFAPPPVAVTPEPAAPPAPPAAGPAEAPPGLPAPATPAAAGGGETAAVTAPPPAAPQEPRIGPPILPRLIDEEPPEAAAQPKRRGYWRR